MENEYTDVYHLPKHTIRLRIWPIDIGRCIAEEFPEKEWERCWRGKESIKLPVCPHHYYLASQYARDGIPALRDKILEIAKWYKPYIEGEIIEKKLNREQGGFIYLPIRPVEIEPVGEDEADGRWRIAREERYRKRKAGGKTQEECDELEYNYCIRLLVRYARRWLKGYQDLTVKEFHNLSWKEKYDIFFDFWVFNEKDDRRYFLNFPHEYLRLEEEISHHYDSKTKREFDTPEEMIEWIASEAREELIKEIMREEDPEWYMIIYGEDWEPYYDDYSGLEYKQREADILAELRG